MRQAFQHRFWLLLGLLVGALALSGCFQTAGQELNPTPLGNLPVQQQELPSLTPEPVQPVATTEPVIPPTQEILPTQETLDGVGGALATPLPGFSQVAATATTGVGALLPTQDLNVFLATPTTPPTQQAVALVVSPTLDPVLVQLTLAAQQAQQQAQQAVPLAQQTTVAQAPLAQATSAAPFLTATALFGGNTDIVPQATATPPAGLPTQDLTGLQGLQPSDPLLATATALTQQQFLSAAATLTAMAPTPTITVTPTPDPTLDCVHVVRRGENAYRIARQYDVTLDEIAQANNLTNLRVLSIGQELIIPGCGVLEVTATPQPAGDTDSGSGTTGGQTYVVQPGDNLYRIALRFGVTMSELANANGITNINYLRAGDTLIIP